VDRDAYSIAISAFNLKNAGIYTASRLPGYPLPELSDSLVINFGWLATNSLIMIISLISVIFFVKILTNLNVRNRGLLVPTYAFFPLIWVNSANTMDYMWSLSFMIFCWFSVTKKWYVVAGVMMGLAIASRLTAIFLMIPFVYLVLSSDRRWSSIVGFVMATLVTASLFFLPLYLTYDTGFLRYYPWHNPLFHALDYAFHEFGDLVVIFGAAIFLLSLKTLFIQLKSLDKRTIFLLVSVIVIITAFVNAPYDTEYLIPAIPFTILLLNNLCNSPKMRKIFVIFCGLILLNAFVTINVEIDVDNKAITFDSERGLILRNIYDREFQIHVAVTIATADISNHSIVIVGWYYIFIFPFLNDDVSCQEEYRIFGGYEIRDWERDISYVTDLTLEELQQFIDNSYKIYYIEWERSIIQGKYGYDLDDYGCIPIRIS